MATSLADHRTRVRAGRNRWSTGQHFCPARAMCGPAALDHSTTGLLGSQTCNRSIHIQPHGWIAAPCRTGLSSTHISDNVCTNMEWIKNDLRKSSTLTEFLQRTTTCWPGKTPRSRGVGRVHWLVEHSATTMVTLAPDHDTVAGTRSAAYGKLLLLQYGAAQHDISICAISGWTVSSCNKNSFSLAALRVPVVTVE